MAKGRPRRFLEMMLSGEKLLGATGKDISGLPTPIRFAVDTLAAPAFWATLPFGGALGEPGMLTAKAVGRRAGQALMGRGVAETTSKMEQQTAEAGTPIPKPARFAMEMLGPALAVYGGRRFVGGAKGTKAGISAGGSVNPERAAAMEKARQAFGKAAKPNESFDDDLARVRKWEYDSTLSDISAAKPGSLAMLQALEREEKLSRVLGQPRGRLTEANAAQDRFEDRGTKAGQLLRQLENSILQHKPDSKDRLWMERHRDRLAKVLSRMAR